MKEEKEKLGTMIIGVKKKRTRDKKREQVQLGTSSFHKRNGKRRLEPFHERKYEEGIEAKVARKEKIGIGKDIVTSYYTT